MINFTKIFKWRALIAGLLLAAITGFLYGKNSASNEVLMVLSLASLLHILLFYVLLIKDLKKA